MVQERNHQRLIDPVAVGCGCLILDLCELVLAKPISKILHKDLEVLRLVRKMLVLELQLEGQEFMDWNWDFPADSNHKPLQPQQLRSKISCNRLNNKLWQKFEVFN